MRICYVNPTILLKRPIAQIIQKLCNKHEISLLIPKKLFKKRDLSLHYSELPKNVKILAYSSISIPGISSEWPIPIDLRFFYYAFKILRESDIIHMWTHFYFSNFIIIFLKLFMPEKKLILAIDTFPGYSFSAGKIMDLLFRVYTKTFARLVYFVPTKIQLYGKSLIEYAEQSGIKTSKIIVVPTGIALKEHKEVNSIRIELGIASDETVVLYAGLLVPRKGVDIAIRTIASVKNEKIKLILVGDGPNRANYEKQAEALGIKNNVIFTGWRKDVQNFYVSADIFFFPSRGEGLAGVIMEAMSFKLPVITTKIPCTTDLIIDNETGLLCKQDDITEFIEKLGMLVQDKALRKKLGEQACRYIQKYEWSKIIPRYEELYGSL